jgi:hypothetical protein
MPTEIARSVFILVQVCVWSGVEKCDDLAR